MATSEFRVRMDGPVSIVEVRGPLDDEAAGGGRHITSLGTTCRPPRSETTSGS